MALQPRECVKRRPTEHSKVVKLCEFYPSVFFSKRVLFPLKSRLVGELNEVEWSTQKEKEGSGVHIRGMEQGHAQA